MDLKIHIIGSGLMVRNEQALKLLFEKRDTWLYPLSQNYLRKKAVADLLPEPFLKPPEGRRFLKGIAAFQSYDST